MAVKLFFYAPAGGSITNMQTDADFAPSSSLSESSYNGIQVSTCMIRLSAQQQATFTYTVTTSAEATEPLEVRSTPTSQVAAGWESANALARHMGKNANGLPHRLMWEPVFMREQ